MSTVLITGASSGIGEACALRLAADGWKVLAGVRQVSDGDRLRQAAGKTLLPILLDVTVPASIAAAQKVVGDRALDGLVQSAGIVVAGPLESVPLAALRRQLEVNVTGVVAVAQAFLPNVRTARGRVVHIGAVSGRIAYPFLGPYAASKFALAALTDALRMELRPWGIHVALVEPGAIRTSIWDKFQRAADLPAGPRPLYGEAWDRFHRKAAASGSAAASPDEVVAAVGHALSAERPRTRYLVAAGNPLALALLRALPDELRDRFVLRSFGLHGGAELSVGGMLTLLRKTLSGS